MDSQRVPRGQALRIGWARTKQNLALFVPLCLVSWFLSGLQGGMGRWHGAAVLLRWLLAPLLLLLTVQVSMAWLRIALRITDGERADLSELLRVDVERYFKYLIGWLLYGLIVACGMVLLIVPGVLWAARYGLAPLLIVDQGMDPLQAMRRSAVLTAPLQRELVWFGLVLLGLNVLGALALGIGLFATAPTSVLAATYVYRRLSPRDADLDNP